MQRINYIPKKLATESPEFLKKLDKLTKGVDKIGAILKDVKKEVRIVKNYYDTAMRRNYEH